MPVALGLRLGFAGLLIAVGTLIVVAWGEDRYDLTPATTMGLVTTGLLHIAAAIEWRDPIHSIFNRATIANGRFNLLVVLAFVLTFLATTIGGLQRMLDTVELTGDQWRVCLIAVIGYLVARRDRQVHLPPRPQGGRRMSVISDPASTADERRAWIGEQLRVAPGAAADLAHRDSGWVGGPDYEDLTADELDDTAKAKVAASVEALADAQELLWADATRAVLVVFQAMDAAGKDSTIKHVMSGVNPQGVDVTSFRHPTAEELAHPFLWRTWQAVPAKGRIGIFNRSHYEEVVALRVHPEWLAAQHLPDQRHRRRPVGRPLRRHQRVRAAPRPHRRDDRQVLPPRLQGRAEAPLPASPGSPTQGVEVQRRRHRRACSAGTTTWRRSKQAISATSTPWAPWHVIPADHKHVMQAMVAAVLADTVESLGLTWPTVSPDEHAANVRARQELMDEDDTANTAGATRADDHETLEV